MSDCGHHCCNERSNPRHYHFQQPRDCPVCIDESIDAGVVAVFAAFPGDTWRDSSLRGVLRTAMQAGR